MEPPQAAGREREPLVYRLGGNSCLSGDFMGYWRFEQPLQIGDTIRFSDMIHYTTVKTNMFNGIPHPSLVLLRENGEEELLRRFGYEDIETEWIKRNNDLLTKTNCIYYERRKPDCRIMHFEN